MVRRGAVLLAEDDDDHREALEALVCLTGLHAFTVRTGAEALAYLRREPRLWCIVVLDWWLPDMTGEHFRRQQRADHRIADIPVAVLTGDGRAKEAAERAGFAHFLLKPVEPSVVTRLLMSHCQDLRATSTSDECGCGGFARSQLQRASGAGGKTADLYGAIWRSIAEAERRQAESRRAWERARQLRELAEAVRAGRFSAPKMRAGGALPWPVMHPDGRASSMEAGTPSH